MSLHSQVLLLGMGKFQKSSLEDEIVSEGAISVIASDSEAISFEIATPSALQKARNDN